MQGRRRARVLPMDRVRARERVGPDGGAPRAASLLCRVVGGAAILLAVLGAALGAGAVTAAAADERGMEMVSPPDKNGNDVIFTYSTIRTALSGDELTFSSPAPFAGAESGPLTVQYVSERTARGWTTRSLSPPSESVGLYSAVGAYGRYMGFTPRLTVGFLQSLQSLSPGAKGGYFNLYARDLASAQYRLVSATTLAIADDPITQPALAGASDDGEHVIFQSMKNLTADATGFSQKLYEGVGGELRMVGQIPVAPATRCGAGGPACVASTGGAIAGSGAQNAPSVTYTERAISTDGARIYFAAPASNGQLYVRQDGIRTVRVSAPAADAPSDTTQPARFWAATPDGRYVFFTSAQKLTHDSMASPFSPSGPDLYRYDAVTGDLIDISVSSTGASAWVGEAANGAGTSNTGGVIGVSDDGRRAYFAANNQIVAGAPNVPGPHLYRWDEGVGVRYIGTSAGSATDDNLIWTQSGPKQSRVTPDGSRMLFLARARLDPDKDNDGHLVAYLYDAASDHVTCISCPRVGPATADASMQPRMSGTGGLLGGESKARTQYRARYLTDDGQRAFIQTAERLVDSDSNGREDVYEWHDGNVRLVTSGRSGTDSYFGDASPDGHDVFVVTRERLVAADQDNNLDVYDARIGGGFPAPERPTPPCSGDTCQGSPNAVPSLRRPATGSILGDGNDQPGRPARFSIVTMSKRQRAKLARTGRATVRVRVSTAGLVVLRSRARVGRRVRVMGVSARRASRAGTLALQMRLSRAGLATLRRRGVLKVRMIVEFSAAADAKSALVRLARARRGAARHKPSASKSGGGREHRGGAA